MANKKEKITYEVGPLITMFSEYRSYKQSILREWRLVRSLYNGDFWNVFKKNLKDYTVTPDWNYFEYVVQAYLNSVYSGAFIGTVTPVNIGDEEAVTKLNAFLSYNWNKWGMKNKFLHIGENAELYNIGAVRVDWDTDKGSVVIKALSPQELYFDPSVESYKEGAAIFIERAVNIDTLKLNPTFKDGVIAYEKDHRNNLQDKTKINRIVNGENHYTSNNKTVSLIECFKRNDKGGIDQIFILDETTIIHEVLNLKITKYPVVCYTPQRPDGNPYGRSKLNKIMNTVVALNLLDSMEATEPYRLMNRVRFVNVDGRINMRSFTDYGNTPGATFQCKGNPKELISYEDIPLIGDRSSIKQRLENSIFQVTGVDAYYKGRTTNSLQTTGATQAFQSRVTMLTDNSRITLLEEFCEDLTRVILEYYFEHGGSTEYKVPKMSATGTNKVIAVDSIDFSTMRETVKFDYKIAASTLLPMNQAQLYDSAKTLYEMQGQYQFKTELISPEDLVRWSDFPQKDLILQRIAKSKQDSTADNLIADLTNFASIFSKLLASGLTEEQAASQAIEVLLEEKNQMQQDPTIGQGFQ